MVHVYPCTQLVPTCACMNTCTYNDILTLTASGTSFLREVLAAGASVLLPGFVLPLVTGHIASNALLKQTDLCWHCNTPCNCSPLLLGVTSEVVSVSCSMVVSGSMGNAHVLLGTTVFFGATGVFFCDAGVFFTTAVFFLGRLSGCDVLGHFCPD